jgi:hypothetical protein
VPATLTLASVSLGEVLTTNLLFKLVFPPTFKFLPMPTPPFTAIAPVVLLLDSASL